MSQKLKVGAKGRIISGVSFASREWNGKRCQIVEIALNASSKPYYLTIKVPGVKEETNIWPKEFKVGPTNEPE